MTWLSVAHFGIYKRTFAIPNGGNRSASEGARFKREGVKAGVPDIFIAHPVSPYSGLFIEFKYGKNKPTESQFQMIKELSDAGYRCAVCYSANDGMDCLRKYLNGI